MRWNINVNDMTTNLLSVFRISSTCGRCNSKNRHSAAPAFRFSILNNLFTSNTRSSNAHIQFLSAKSIFYLRKLIPFSDSLKNSRRRWKNENMNFSQQPHRYEFRMVWNETGYILSLGELSFSHRVWEVINKYNASYSYSLPPLMRFVRMQLHMYAIVIKYPLRVNNNKASSYESRMDKYFMQAGRQAVEEEHIKFAQWSVVSTI